MAERALTATDWRGYAQGQFPRDSWSVDGDVLRAVARAERVDLITRDSFRDFVLLFEWRLPRCGEHRGAVPRERGGRSGRALRPCDAAAR